MSTDDIRAAVEADSGAFITLDLTKKECSVNGEGTMPELIFMFTLLFTQDEDIKFAAKMALEFLDTEVNKTEGNEDDSCGVN